MSALPRSHADVDRIAPEGPREVNRVVEGWHPSDPERVGLNALVDGTWLGTFETLDSAARVVADTTKDNVASQRTIERAGFHQTGTNGDHYLYEVLLNTSSRPARTS